MEQKYIFEVVGQNSGELTKTKFEVEEVSFSRALSKVVGRVASSAGLPHDSINVIDIALNYCCDNHAKVRLINEILADCDVCCEPETYTITQACSERDGLIYEMLTYVEIL